MEGPQHFFLIFGGSKTRGGVPSQNPCWCQGAQKLILVVCSPFSHRFAVIFFSLLFLSLTGLAQIPGVLMQRPVGRA